MNSLFRKAGSCGLRLPKTYFFRQCAKKSNLKYKIFRKAPYQRGFPEETDD
jgi:hypothetical protein